MHSETFIPPIIHVPETPSETTVVRRSPMATAWRTLIFFWKYLVGVFLTQTILGAILIVGWSYRLAQRSALRVWWRRSGQKRKGERVGDYLARHEPAHQHIHWPNWLLHQNFRAASRRDPAASNWQHAAKLLRLPFSSLTANLRIGLQGIFNTWVLTMPGCVLWLFSWYDGWNNSFNKGYEQAFVGPATGWFGIMLFIAAMFYVPLAQARQAVTGDWRSFYAFSFVSRLVRRHWLANLLLAALSSFLFLPVVILKTAPYFFDKENLVFADGPPADAIQFLNDYFFFAALLVFPVYVLLRVVAARIYARGVLLGVQTGEIAVDELSPVERAELQRLNLIQVSPPRSRHVLLRVARSTTSLVFLVFGLIATWLVWFTFVAQIYISEFLNYHEALGWLNQPVVQLPWFRYIPDHLHNPAGELLAAAGIVALLFAARFVVIRGRALFHRGGR